MYVTTNVDYRSQTVTITDTRNGMGFDYGAPALRSMIGMPTTGPVDGSLQQAAGTGYGMLLAATYPHRDAQRPVPRSQDR